MDRRVYWLWLQHAFSPGSSKPKSISNRFDSLEEFYRGGLPIWSRMSFISEKDLTSLANYSLSQAEATLEYCEKVGQHIITPEDWDYPELLWNIPDPPAVLYLRGTMPELDSGVSIGVVGSRKTGELALKTAEKLSYELSKAGIVVISGGAVGVDTAAHRGAMMGPTPTVAVLGCGLDYPYLMENELMRQRIISKGGALVTEYPPSMGIQKGTFQIRNRIISGLARGVLIVSAAQKSGTMITARRATEQNRDLFAVPGNPLLPTSEGPNALIRDGAVPVSSGYEIAEFYQHSAPKSPSPEARAFRESLFTEYDSPKREEEPPENREGAGNETAQPETEAPQPEEKSERAEKSDWILSSEAEIVFRVLEEEPLHISEISSRTALTPSQILTAVTELELMDLIRSYSGQRYARKEE